MYDIQKTEFGWAVFLNGLPIKLFGSESGALSYVARAQQAGRGPVATHQNN